MRINWFSNAAWFPSGYGVQTKLFVPRIKGQGHEMTITAFAGLHGAPLTIDGIETFPAARHRYGQDVMGAVATLTRADAIISLLDIWVVEPERLKTPWYPWYPIDCEPMPKIVYNSVKQAAKGIVMSKFGQRMAEAVGLETYYVPHGVDTKTFKPVDRAASREHLRWPADKFIVGMVAANVGNPPRKSFFEQIAAFAIMHGVHPDTMLYLHCDDGTRVGPDMAVDLVKYCQVMGLRVGYMNNDPVSGDVDVLFPDQFFYGVGMIPDHYMVAVYNSLDVLLMCSLGEGFGIPLIEAQACGCPVITGDWTAMGELCFGGWLVSKSDADPSWHPFFESFQYRVKVESLIKPLADAYVNRGNQDLRDYCREGALEYDADLITEKYWKPVLADIEARSKIVPLHSVAAHGQTERVVEVPWLLNNLGKPLSILDIGSTDALYLTALQKTGAKVTCIDTRPFQAPDGVKAMAGDASKLPDYFANCFNLITCVSVLDHVGLEAYGNAADAEALPRMAGEMHRVLAGGGRMLLTVPVGVDYLTNHPGGGQRVFSRDALQKLFPANKWAWTHETYWVLVNDAYVEVEWNAIEEVKYAQYRAGAVVGLELTKL